MEIQTADVVRHVPTGEEWLVAGVNGERLMWCGWPQGTANIADCELVRKAAPGERDRLLREMASMPGHDMRKAYALQHLPPNDQVER